MAITISLCMIVKNEEENLGRCLKSVRGVFDEINIVDTGSTDGTIAVAKQFTDRIFHFDWINDFAAARNFSFSKATMDYIFWLDADDVVTTVNRYKLIELKRTLDTNIDFVTMYYEYAFDEKGRPVMTQSRERLMKRACNFQWANPLHETVTTTGFRGVGADIAISHKHRNTKRSEARNTSIIEGLHETGKKTARNLFYYAVEMANQGYDKEAIAGYQELFATPMDKDNPFDSTIAYISCAGLHIKHGELEEAYALLSPQAERLSDKAEFHCALAQYYIAKEDGENAKQCFETALTCKGSVPMNNTRIFDHRYEEYYTYIPHQALGRLYLMEKNFEKAWEHFEAAASYNDSDPEVAAMADKLRRLHELQQQAKEQPL